MLRMMIADDEQWILDGLRVQLNWAQLGVEIICEANNGSEALRLLETRRPDIVLIDIRMPILDGLRFAQQVQRQRADCILIIMSGYADFSYVQQAMKYGVDSFVTKPIDRAELEEAVRKAVLTLREKRALRAISFNSEFAVESAEGWRKLRAQGALPPDGRMIALDLAGEPGEEELRYLADYAAARCDPFLRAPMAAPVYVGICSRDACADTAGLRLGVQHMLMGLERGGNAVIGAPITGQLDVDACGQRLEHILSSIRGIRHGEVLLEEEFSAGQRMVSIPYAGAEHILKAIGNVDAPEALARLNDVRGFLMDALNYEHGLLLQFLLSGMDALLRPCDTGIEQLFSEHIQLVNHLGSDLSREKEYLILEDGVRRSIDYLREHRQSAGSAAVLDVRAYIDAHYSEDLSLTALAARFFLAPTQLSREFKRITGINLNRYIRQTRLHYAAVLLSNTDLKTAEVSLRVGYDNPDYFMKLFREAYNLTPSAYRNMLNCKIIE